MHFAEVENGLREGRQERDLGKICGPNAETPLTLFPGFLGSPPRILGPDRTDRTGGDGLATWASTQEGAADARMASRAGPGGPGRPWKGEGRGSSLGGGRTGWETQARGRLREPSKTFSSWEGSRTEAGCPEGILTVP